MLLTYVEPKVASRSHDLVTSGVRHTHAIWFQALFGCTGQLT
jgi:hypothetical protein